MGNMLIINANPKKAGFCNAITERYALGAESAGADVKMLNLRHLRLEPWLKYDWSRNHDSIPLSPDLKRAKRLIGWSDHLVFAYPTYWAAPPALLKVFLETIITSGFAFKYHKPIQLPFGRIPRVEKLLGGRTATLISTMDAPPLFMMLYEGDPGGLMMRDTLRFIGIKLIRRHYIGSVVLSDGMKRKEWLAQSYKLGKKEARELLQNSSSA
jgi:NAD(P)H dehydrogenase (quinone)